MFSSMKKSKSTEQLDDNDNNAQVINIVSAMWKKKWRVRDKWKNGEVIHNRKDREKRKQSSKRVQTSNHGYRREIVDKKRDLLLYTHTNTQKSGHPD